MDTSHDIVRKMFSCRNYGAQVQFSWSMSNEMRQEKKLNKYTLKWNHGKRILNGYYVCVCVFTFTFSSNKFDRPLPFLCERIDDIFLFFIFFFFCFIQNKCKINSIKENRKYIIHLLVATSKSFLSFIHRVYDLTSMNYLLFIIQ